MLFVVVVRFVLWTSSNIMPAMPRLAAVAAAAVVAVAATVTLTAYGAAPLPTAAAHVAASGRQATGFRILPAVGSVVDGSIVATGASRVVSAPDTVATAVPATDAGADARVDAAADEDVNTSVDAGAHPCTATGSYQGP